MGGWGEWEDVERNIAGADVWLDTAFSIGPIYPNAEDPVPPIASYNLTDEDFVRLSRKHGTDRILFATDSPWASQLDYAERIRSLPFSEEEREQIFSENAVRLLKLSL
jgi:predicted TIM-barrel fold metal-dependent hydrolase